QQVAPISHVAITKEQNLRLTGNGGRKWDNQSRRCAKCFSPVDQFVNILNNFFDTLILLNQSAKFAYGFSKPSPCQADWCASL
ncbi:MAG: hypothetical protein ACK56I_10760, partial [bacterium]